MAESLIEQIVSSINLPPEHPLFLSRIFSKVAKARKELFAGGKRFIEMIVSEEYDELSRRLDKSKIQESIAVRNVLRTRKLAALLINDKGEFDAESLSQATHAFEQNFFSLGADRQHDSRRQEQILNVLKSLKDNKETARLLKNIGKPHAHPRAEQIIRDTLDLPANAPITDAWARRAALAAWMCYLRQNIGSCFATAPAIIVHDEQPAQFLQDLNDLLSTGRLKRTYAGVEYSVPLSISWGAGDLKKNILLMGESGFEQSDIWLSPGLLAAFQAVGLVDPEKSLKQRHENLKELILKTFQKNLEKQSFVITSPEKIILQVLMEHLGINEVDMGGKDSLGLAPQSNFLTNLTKKPNHFGKSALLAKLAAMQEVAGNAFKALADNALLKSWEFTLASFAETKADFATWNLYSSLGLKPDEEGGIGQAMFAVLKDKLEQTSRKVQDLQSEYEQMYNQVKSIESRMQRATSEKELQWIRIEYQTQINELRLLEEMRDKSHHKAQRIAGMYDALIDAFLELFPRYFQEVYDADMHEVTAGPYDDSPAGFRLLYKYGRASSSQWTYIHSPEEFIDSLYSFFIATETELSSRSEFTGLEQELSELITAAASQIRTPQFLESAFVRMAIFHKTPLVKNPLENLSKIEKKPWAYTSGGTMSSLVSCYFRLENKPTEVGRWVENPMELLVFFIDTLKQIPHQIMADFQKNGRKSLLIHSPTHAFLLKPMEKIFHDAWQNDAFTYTWVRDQIIIPMIRKIDAVILDPEMQQYLIKQLEQHIPEDFRFYFNKIFSRFQKDMTTLEFRNYLIENMRHERGLQHRGVPVLNQAEIDSFIFSNVPLVPRRKLREAISEILKGIPTLPVKTYHQIMKLWDSFPDLKGGEPLISSKKIIEIAKAFISLATLKTSLSEDYHGLILESARACGYALAAPVQVADTNWVKDHFGFVVNPGSGRVEFWRLDPYGNEGAPMSAWEEWLNGSRKDASWGVYTRPYEYLK